MGLGLKHLLCKQSGGSCSCINTNVVRTLYERSRGQVYFYNEECVGSSYKSTGYAAFYLQFEPNARSSD